MAIVLAVIAVPLALLTPLAREGLRWIERYARVKLEIQRHLEGRTVAEGFVRAVRSGRLGDAERSTTVGFRKTLAPSSTFQEFAAASPLRLGPCELIEGTTSYSDEQGHLVSEYDFRCGDEGARRTLAKLLLVIEAGVLKVDHIEYVEEPR